MFIAAKIHSAFWDNQLDRKETYIKKAGSLFEQGYNCAQSVLLTMQDFWNEKTEVEPQIASAFGGGIGLKGSLCGALTGGVMAIGLKYGSSKPIREERRKAQSIALKFFDTFKRQNHSVLCRELIGYDLADVKGRQEAWEANVFATKCLPLVKESIRILIDLERS